MRRHAFLLILAGIVLAGPRLGAGQGQKTLPAPVKKIIARSCSVSGCHQGKYPASNLSLEPDKLPGAALNRTEPGGSGTEDHRRRRPGKELSSGQDQGRTWDHRGAHAGQPGSPIGRRDPGCRGVDLEPQERSRTRQAAATEIKAMPPTRSPKDSGPPPPRRRPSPGPPSGGLGSSTCRPPRRSIKAGSFSGFPTASSRP